MKKILSIALLTIVLISSCNKTEDSPSNIIANDFSKSVDENQTMNSIIGTINATSSDGVLTYSLENQYPAGAMAINRASGEITVADASAFDFETNPTITATVTIEGNTITETSEVTITLNDTDDLEFLLSDSKSAYTAASNGDWVIITKTEYDNLAAALNNVSKVATEETDYLTDDSLIASNAPAYTLANGNGVDIPASSYVFAFRFYSKSDNHSGSKVKVSDTTIKTGYSDLGGVLPTVNKGDNFFILKGNNTKTENLGYLAYTFNGYVGFNDNDKRIVYSSGDSETLVSDSPINSTFLYQGLSTTQKQW